MDRSFFSASWRLLTVAVLSSPWLQGDPLTLSRALRLADESHPQLRAGTAQIDVARAGLITARTYPNPEVGFQVGRQMVRIPGNVPGMVSTYSFTQPLEIGPLRPARIEFAERFVNSSELARAEVRLFTLTRVRRSFFEVLRRLGEITLATENLRLVEDLRKRIAVRVDVGEAGRLELIRADAEVATARTQANSARLRLVNEESQLRAAIAAPLEPVLSLEGALEPAITLPPLQELWQEASERHPALALARAEVRRAESRITYEQALLRPQPAIRSDIERYPDVPNYRVGVQFALPFWNRRKGPLAEAAAEVRRTSALVQARELEIKAALESAYGRYQLASQQLAAFEEGLLREAAEAVRAAETAYQLGERGILEVLDAQRVLRTVRLDFLNAQYDRQAALIDLDELRALDLGRLMP
ncbi:MAG: TolC family protein [Bryobacterales bacterium]|nr:TolC family protein [Bryobacterales bacterium]